jgi:hypothetical protein
MQKPKPRYPIAICTGKGLIQGCGKSKPIVHKSLKLCFYCNVNRLRKLSEARRKKRGSFIDYPKLQKFYKQFWDSQVYKRCFETGEPLPFFRNWFCHHVLDKKHYPEHTYNQEVMVLLTLEVHSDWHASTEEDKAIKHPKTYAKLCELRNKYNLK